MRQWFTHFLLFSLFSLVQVRFVDAADYTIPAEEPKDCLSMQSVPCHVTTGDEPRMFEWEKSRFELDRNIVLNLNQKKVWNFYKGLFVLDSKGEHTIHTPFGDIYVGQSKIMVHVLKEKMRVLCLDGQGVKVKPKGHLEESFLVPGFQNWYGGVVNGEADSGVATVIDLNEFSKMRAPFFLNYQLGFPKELATLASRIKWAAGQASLIHRELYERKVASLDQAHDKKVEKKRRKIQYNKYLRQLFLKKVNYDD